MLFSRYVIDVGVEGRFVSVAILRRPFLFAPRRISPLIYLSRVEAQDAGASQPILTPGGEIVPPGSLPIGPLYSSPLVRALFPKGTGALGIGQPEVAYIVREAGDRMTRGRRSRTRWVTRGFALLGAFYLVTTLIGGGSRVTPAQGQAAPVRHVNPTAQVVPQEDSSAAIATRVASSMPKLTFDEAATDSKGITLTPGKPLTSGGQRLVVWADPLCPHCRDLEAQIEALPQEVGVTLIPVSFQPGSRVFASYVLCGASDAENRNRWMQLMLPQPQADPSLQCAAGPDAADRNSAWFARTGDRPTTPTIAMVKNDKLIPYTGDVTKVTTAALVGWMKG